jgi:hypothetical protein
LICILWLARYILHALASKSSDSSPTSHVAVFQAWLSCAACWPSSIAYYRSFSSQNRDCSLAGRYNSSSATLFLLWALLPCFFMASRLWVLNAQWRHCSPPPRRRAVGQSVSGKWHASIIVCKWECPDVFMGCSVSCLLRKCSTAQAGFAKHSSTPTPRSTR